MKSKSEEIGLVLLMVILAIKAMGLCGLFPLGFCFALSLSLREWWGMH